MISVSAIWTVVVQEKCRKTDDNASVDVTDGQLYDVMTGGLSGGHGHKSPYF